MSEAVWAEKWEELCECLKWGKNTPVETILLQFHAVNQGNQDKKKRLDALKNKFKEYDQPPLGMTRSKIVEQMRKILWQSSDETGEEI